MWTSSADAKYSSRTIWFMYSIGMVEIAPIRFLFAQICVRLRSIADAPGPHWHRSPTVVSYNWRRVSVTPGDYVTGKSAGYENQVLPLIRRIFSRSITFCLKHDIRLHVMKINGAKQNGLIGSSYWVVRCVEHSLHTRVFYVLRLNFLDHWKKVCKGDR